MVPSCGRLPFSSLRGLHRGMQPFSVATPREMIMSYKMILSRCRVPIFAMEKPCQQRPYYRASNEVQTQHERETTERMRTPLARRYSGDLNCGLPKNSAVRPRRWSRSMRKVAFESSARDSRSYEPLPRINTNLKLTAHLLLKAMREGLPTQNIVCSPLSLQFVMNMVAMGSKGDTLKQLLSFIGSSSLDDVRMMSSSIMKVTSSSCSGGPQISFANAVWVDKKFPIKPSFNDVLSGIYKAEVKNVEMTQPDRVIDEVNSWVDNKTKGLIKKILGPRSLDAATMIILGNALYFKEAWDDEFDAECTKHRDFYLLNGETVSVPFMTSSYKYGFKAYDGFKVLQVPYKSEGYYTRRFSMYILLPDKIDGLENLLERINSNPEFLHHDFHLKIAAFDNFWIPKFKFSYNLDADKEMKELGLTLPFDMDCKDITEMVNASPLDNLYFSKVIHKAVIEVDEKGTEAAAVTFAMGYGGCAPLSKIKRYDFVADHPFLFMIREDLTGAVFFVGTVSNPLEEED